MSTQLVGTVLAWGAYGWIAGLLLVVVLSAKEMVRVYGAPRTDLWMRRFNAVAVPLVIIFAAAVVVRILSAIVVV